MIQNNVLLLAGAAVLIIVLTILLVLSSRKKSEECKTSCPNSLDSLLATVPSNAEDLSTSKSIGIPNVQNVFFPCVLTEQGNTLNTKTIGLQGYGQLFTNKNNATKSKYPYVFRPYTTQEIAVNLDGGDYAAQGSFISKGLCDKLKTQTVYGTPLECSSTLPCPTGKTCKLDGDDNMNNACV